MYRTHIIKVLGFLASTPGGYLHAPLEIEYDEATGKIGTLPEPVQKMVDGLIGQAHKSLRKEIDDLKTKIGSGNGDATERERLRALEEENQRFKTEAAERKNDYD